MDELSSIIFINVVFGVNLLYINNDKNTSIVMFQKYLKYTWSTKTKSTFNQL